MLLVITLVTYLACAQASLLDVISSNGRPRFNMELRIAVDGYYSESHNVITSDGYILEINRIPNPRFQKGSIRPGSKPVVFLMHGLQSSALAFITAGPDVALAYILADTGYDVWVGNARGIINSRRHIFLDPDNERDRVKFFDYSFEDVAIKDLPAMIDFVLRRTQQEKLNYIGHSQGGTAFLVLNSLKPEYNNKFITSHLLAGVGFQYNFPNNILSAAAINTDLIYTLAVNAGIVELFGPNDNNRFAVALAAEARRIESKSLGSIIDSIMESLRDLYAALESVAGASIKQYAHFGQNIRDKAFRRWNFINPLENLWRYGSWTPPSYDLSLVTVDITMHYTIGDILLDELDVHKMASSLPNARVRRVARDSFSHFDFVIAADSRELVSDYIIERFNEKNK